VTGEVKIGVWSGLAITMDTQGQLASLHFDAAAEPRFLVLEYQKPQPPQPGCLTLEAEQPGYGSDVPHLRLPLLHSPVHECTLYTVEGQSQWRTWESRADFDASGRADAHVVQEHPSSPATATPRPIKEM
jgi:hypothetical protein